MPTNNMGDPNNITEDTFDKAAKAAGQSSEDAKKETLKQLQKQLENK